jgi:hypothetical protein
MTDETPDLWPEDLGGGQDFVTPAAVLRGAASQLGNRTRQLVTADISTRIQHDRFVHQFWIEVPSLDYRYSLFELSHPVNSFYPLRTDRWANGAYMELESEEELKEYLKQIFASEKTRSLVATLLQQVAN